MRLTLSSKSVCNAVFTDETNQVVYKTSCPLFGNLTTIYKAVLRNAASGKAPSGGTTFVRNNRRWIGVVSLHVLNPILPLSSATSVR